MNDSAAAPCELLPWDTDFFGCRIARVRGHALRAEQIGPIDDWSRANQIRALYFLADAGDPLTLGTAARNQFELVDIRLTLSWDAGAVSPANNARAASIRPFAADDLPTLQTLARAAHRDSRFFSDPHFSPQRAADLYATWITVECRGRAQKVFVAALEARRPAGYISCHFDSARRVGEIGLVGVDAAFRGQGLGRQLVRSALDWFQSQGATTVSVVTQGKNLSAQRLYQRCGFLSQSLQLWHHKWYPDQDRHSA